MFQTFRAFIELSFKSLMVDFILSTLDHLVAASCVATTLPDFTVFVYNLPRLPSTFYVLASKARITYKYLD